VRRVALLAPALGGEARRELEATLSWLATLPLGGLSRHLRLAEVPLEVVDVLWAFAAEEPTSRLGDWLAAGGRLVATGDGTSLGAALGLESRSPAELRLEDVPADYGLAGFGPHPLFAGLNDGAFLRPVSGTMRCYSPGQPPRAGVVAVERRGLELVPERVLAWEYGVGHGGVLCLAFAPPVDDPESAIVVANALVGDAVPHRDRGAAPLWPVPGRRAVSTAPDGLSLPRPSDPWPDSAVAALDLAPSTRWTHTGRRALVRACPRDGTREVWAPPVRVMRGARVVDALPCAPIRMSAAGTAGGLATGGYRLRERWLAAPDSALVVWEIGGPAGVPITLEWEVDLRRAWPFPPGAYGDLQHAVTDDGAALRVGALAGPRALFAVSSGALNVQPLARSDGPAVRVRCAAATPVRIVAAGGVDAEELERSLRVLARDGVAGLASARERRVAQLERYGTALEAPDELLGHGFERAREVCDEALVGAPAVGRSLLTGCPRPAPEDAWCFGAASCSAAAAQLIAGNRDPARDVLRFLSRTQRADGSVPACVPLGGSSSAGDPASTRSLLELAERFLAWTGETEALRRFREPIGRALRYLAERGPAGAAPEPRVLDALEDLLEGAEEARALVELRARAGDVAAAAEAATELESPALLQAAAAALRRDPAAVPGSGAATALLDAVGGLWGLEPAAAETALSVAPLLPDEWPGMALRRLRVGRTLLDLELRRRPGALVLRAVHRFGPRLVLTVAPRGVDIEAVEVDDVGLSGVRARFEMHGRHEARFLLRG
jgi:hypothetical protein